MSSPARIHWRIHESIHSGIHVGLHDRVHENTHGGIHDSVHEGIHEIPPRLLDRMPDVYTKRVLHIHLIPQAAPETSKAFEPQYAKAVTA